MARLRSIKQVSEETGVPASAIRFYDRHHLLLDIQRDAAGNRWFDEDAVDGVCVVAFQRYIGMPIKEIREISDMAAQGDHSIGKRYELMLKQRERLQREIESMTEALHVLDDSLDRYRRALRDGEEGVDFRGEDIAAMRAMLQRRLRTGEKASDCGPAADCARKTAE
ncbi:MerR family transcriptional regulator [Bifidobacterium sp. 64T4]|uniref:MerR family transcriptional regulator n=1 Tax=Bifidobacterium pongonis TaxID=2834432 RepID=UPI001C569DE7|nr:MerR family transcriptional regulator [Bifidobacterium pongonis]MBW3095614.1 MerR family transcriptional regulator [Bifidobacterium pongonis]